MQDVAIAKQPIELFKVLKLGGLASSGGEAKSMIAEGLVMVNGVSETRKRRQIVSGDVVSVAGETVRVQVADG